MTTRQTQQVVSALRSTRLVRRAQLYTQRSPGDAMLRHSQTCDKLRETKPCWWSPQDSGG